MTTLNLLKEVEFIRTNVSSDKFILFKITEKGGEKNGKKK